MRRVAIKVESVVEFTSRKNKVIVGRLCIEVFKDFILQGYSQILVPEILEIKRMFSFTFSILINSSPGFSRSKLLLILQYEEQKKDSLPFTNPGQVKRLGNRNPKTS